MTMLAMAVACSELYGPEPTPIAPDTAAGVEITVSEVKDSSFTVTVTPSGAASYYSWLVDESPKAAALDSSALYSVSYESLVQGTAKWTAEATSTTFTVDGLTPNTTYQVYAVVGSPLGIPGSVAVKAVTTTDGLAPSYVSVKTDAHQVVFTFSENVKRDAAAGAIKAPYYAPYSADFNTTAAAAGEVTVPEDSVLVAGNQALIAVPDLPEGSLWTISIPEGAFVDAVGQKLPAYSSKFVMVEGEDGPEPAPKGFYGEIEYVELPMLGELEMAAFTEWDGGFLIPLVNEYPLAGFSTKKFITVTYEAQGENTVETVTYTLTPEADYNVTSLGLVVNLPAEPMCLGADVTINVPAGAIYDVFGNDCEEWEHAMKYSYGYTLEDIVGTYDLVEVSAFTGTPGVSELVIAESDDEKKGNVMFTSYGGVDCEKTPIYADFDFDSGILEVPSGQVFGSIKDQEGTEYQLALATGVVKDGSVYLDFDDETPITFEVPQSNTFAGPGYYYGIYVLDEEGTSVDIMDLYYATQATLASEEEEEAPAAVSNSKLPFKSLTVRR